MDVTVKMKNGQKINFINADDVDYDEWDNTITIWETLNQSPPPDFYTPIVIPCEMVRKCTAHYNSINKSYTIYPSR